jgi:hypothetical protein
MLQVKEASFVLCRLETTDKATTPYCVVTSVAFQMCLLGISTSGSDTQTDPYVCIVRYLLTYNNIFMQF